ncbi:hypothetical protein [Niallia sp. 03133]|uniref:hypothetical protein n=1 Tax=Niallia sp. 03133 TaxID=3458060 RepID=UPI004044FB0A
MKKFMSVLCTILVLIGFIGCSKNETKNENKGTNILPKIVESNFVVSDNEYKLLGEVGNFGLVYDKPILVVKALIS